MHESGRASPNLEEITKSMGSTISSALGPPLPLYQKPDETCFSLPHAAKARLPWPWLSP